jgi:hypothetical protein
VPIVDRTVWLVEVLRLDLLRLARIRILGLVGGGILGMLNSLLSKFSLLHPLSSRDRMGLVDGIVIRV